MTEQTAYWIWLQTALGQGARVEEILAEYPTARSIYESSTAERKVSGVFTPRQLEKLDCAKLSDAQTLLRRCATLGQTVYTPEDELYPAALRSLPDLPLALYMRGDITCLCDKLAIAVIGSRSASMKSLEIARRLAHDLARAGAVVVSGCAKGVDSASHTGALSAGGKTVGVLGCGLNTRYLMQSAALREDVAHNGALVTEYPPDAPAFPAHFPLRNRIISGLCSGTLVIEANEKSGSLITARYAAEQGRDVFGVPGDLTSMDYTGVNRLIRDGAKPVFSARDILSEYVWVYDDMSLDEVPDHLSQAAAQKLAPQVPKAIKRLPDDSISETAKRVYAVFRDTPLYTDDLVRATGFEPNRVFTALTELEICGFIKMIEGKRYTIV